MFEILARTTNVNVLFDKEVRDDPITIFIKDLSRPRVLLTEQPSSLFLFD
ncbi:MAG TPA: hypothetical protein VN647_02745 [Nitrospira sp.]|nr:hypothetical protein [Nitrospira sp.]